MNFQTLKAELDLVLYSAMTDAEAATELNAVDKTYRLPSMSGAELFKNTDAAEYNALSDTKKAQWLSFCALDSIDPSGVAVSVVTNIWGGGTTTVANLSAARDVLKSRGEVLGLGFISEENVRYARTL